MKGKNILYVYRKTQNFFTVLIYYTIIIIIAFLSAYILASIGDFSINTLMIFIIIFFLIFHVSVFIELFYSGYYMNMHETAEINNFFNNFVNNVFIYKTDNIDKYFGRYYRKHKSGINFKINKYLNKGYNNFNLISIRKISKNDYEIIFYMEKKNDPFKFLVFLTYYNKFKIIVSRNNSDFMITRLY